jgi:hypothetical protein
MDQPQQIAGVGLPVSFAQTFTKRQINTIGQKIAHMKINMPLIEKMVEAGASGAVVLAYLQMLHVKHEPRKAADRVRKRAEKVRKPTERDRQEATLIDTPRARMFREAKGALLTMNISATRAGALIVEWLKLTHDDEQLVLASILKAQSLAVAEAPSWILATLREKTNGQRGSRTLQDDKLSITGAINRLSEQVEQGSLTFAPRPSLLPNESEDDRRLLSKG